MTDEMRKKHEERMVLALEEMEKQAEQRDPSADPQVFRADVGYGTFARSEGPSGSAKVVRHDTPYHRIRNAHPQLESVEIEALLELCYGQGLYSALLDSFRSFDPAKLQEVLNMSEEEVEDLLYDEEDADE